MSDFGFDTSSIPAATPFEVIPPAWYAMRIVHAEQVDGQKESTGRMLKVTFEVTDKHPEYVNRKVFANFCTHHESTQTREIARSQVAAILKAIGKKGASSIEVLLGAELMVKVAVRPAEGQYEARNDAKGYKPLSAAAPAARPAPAAGAPARQAGWRKS